MRKIVFLFGILAILADTLSGDNLTKKDLLKLICKKLTQIVVDVKILSLQVQRVRI